MTLRGLEARSQVNRAYWSFWFNGSGTRKSQMIPSAEQWEQLRLSLGFGWHYAFEDVYAGVKEIAIPNRVCPICGTEFTARGHQLYDSRFCRFIAKCQRDDDRRKAPAAALRVV